MKSRLIYATAAIALAMGPAAGAHVTASPNAGPAGSSFVTYFRIGHGCDGSATTALRIEIPAEVTGVKPQPKSGWTLKIDHDPAAPATGNADHPPPRPVTAVTWSGGPLPDEEWDQFGLSMKLPKGVGAVVFPAVQTCEQGEERWIDPPSTDPNVRLSHPAPVVTLTPQTGDDSMMMSMPMGH
jgi:uncharacterized protein YcnI